MLGVYRRTGHPHLLKHLCTRALWRRRNLPSGAIFFLPCHKDNESNHDQDQDDNEHDNAGSLCVALSAAFSSALAGSGAAAEVTEVEVKVTPVPSAVWASDSTRTAGLFVTAVAIWAETELVTLL